MNHVSDGALLEVLDGGGSPDDLRHIEGCPRCNGEMEEWRVLADDVRLVAECELEPSELHRLRVQFRALGPVTQGCSDLLGRLLHSTASCPDAVRGGATPVLLEHQAGPFHVAMQARISGSHSHAAVHGQVFSPEQNVGAGEVILSDEQGGMVSGELDELGEFSIRVPRGGHYRVTILLASSRIVIEDLEIAGRDLE